MNGHRQDVESTVERWSCRDRKSARRWTISIVAFAVLLRVLAAIVWQYQCSNLGATLRFGDSQSYWTIARNLVVDGQYQYGSDQSRIFRAPIYPLFLTPFVSCEYYILGNSAQMPSVLLARLAGCLLGGSVVWLLMHWTRQIAGEIAARFAGLLAATYSGAVGMSIFVLSEAVATPLFVASCWMLWQSAGRLQANQQSREYRSDWLWAAGAAIAFGLASLARPSWGLWPAIVFPFMLLASNRRRGGGLTKWVVRASVFLAVLLMVMAPWWVRNYLVTGKFVASTLQVGASLYDGWHPGASGSSDENMEFSMQTMSRIVQEEALLANRPDGLESTLEWRIDRRLRQEAWGWACENPSDAMRLGLVKFWKTWWPLPQARELSNPLIRWWEAGSYMLILIASAMGLYGLQKDGKGWTDACWMALPCVYLAILHMVFVGSVRYRQPAVLVLCGLAGIGLALAWSRLGLGSWTIQDRMSQDRNRKDAVGNTSEPKG